MSFENNNDDVGGVVVGFAVGGRVLVACAVVGPAVIDCVVVSCPYPDP